MSPEAQRIAIAEACGRCPHTEIEYYCVEDGNSIDSGFTCKKCGENPHSTTNRLPDYLSDFNAMHSTEETLTDEEMHDMNESMYLDTSIKRVWRATAAERAKHFLKVKGLWKE